MIPIWKGKEPRCRQLYVLFAKEEEGAKHHLEERSYYSIYYVPRQLQKLNPEAYTPQSVAIGPLHQGDTQQLRISEAQKRHYFNRLTKRCNKTEQQCRSAIDQRLIKKALRCYPNTMTKSAFVTMMVVDSCFILEYLSVFDTGVKDHLVLNTSWQGEIMADMIKLENQLPLTLLQTLYDELFGDQRPNHKSFKSFIYGNFIQSLAVTVSPKYHPELDPPETGEAEHFLDYLRRLIIPISPKMSLPRKKTGICSSGVQFGNFACLTTSNEPPPLIEKFVRLRYSASQLKTAGVKFQQKKEKESFIFDIEFDEEKGILSIPTFHISNNTEVVLRNLIVFEQEKPYEQRYISAYAAFLDDLINTVDDVNLLKEKGIMKDNLGNPEYVAALYNNITRHVSILNPHFAGVINDLEGYYNKGWNRAKANLSQNYFNTPWSKISFAAAVFVIILTVIQTVCSILQSIK